MKLKTEKQKMDWTKIDSLEKINKPDTPLARLTNTQREEIQIANNWNGARDITTDTVLIKWIKWDYYQQLHTQFDKLDKMEKFLEEYTTKIQLGWNNFNTITIKKI